MWGRLGEINLQSFHSQRPELLPPSLEPRPRLEARAQPQPHPRPAWHLKPLGSGHPPANTRPARHVHANCKTNRRGCSLAPCSSAGAPFPPFRIRVRAGGGPRVSPRRKHPTRAGVFYEKNTPGWPCVSDVGGGDGGGARVRRRETASKLAILGWAARRAHARGLARWECETRSAMPAWRVEATLTAQSRYHSAPALAPTPAPHPAGNTSSLGTSGST